jgi:radical SAM protein with 4Fe4S-binding SPASM domain
MAGLMNAIIINAEGNLFKCLQYSTDEKYKVGDCRTGIIFNQSNLDWLDVSIKESECKKCAYLPLCNGGCKSYRALNRPEVSPCVREKDLINTVFNLIHEWVINDDKILDKDYWL